MIIKWKKNAGSLNLKKNSGSVSQVKCVPCIMLDIASDLQDIDNGMIGGDEFVIPR